MMDVVDAAAVLFAVAVSGVIAFQIGLALGAPWGAMAMGGGCPGRFPPRLRAAAVVQAALLAVTGVIVLSRAGVGLSAWSEASRLLIWLVVGIAVVAVALNAASRSAAERRLWVPVAVVMLGSSLFVAVAAG